jgi:hypothetical protein
VLFSAAQLFGEVLFGLLAGGAGVMAYRSATTVLKQRTVVVLRSLPRSGSQARWYHRYLDTV